MTIQKIMTGLVGVLLVCSGSVYGQMVTDVSANDPAYVAISKVVQEGYLSLNTKDTFLGQQPVTRREMALIIEKLLAESDHQELNLTRSDLQELVTVMKAYKQYMSSYDSGMKGSAQSVAKIEEEQKVINIEISRLAEDWKTSSQATKKEQENKDLMMWFGIAAAACIGLIF